MFGRRTRTLQSPKYAEKKRKRAIVFSVLVSLLFIFIVILIILLLHLPFLQISKIEVQGSTLYPVADVEKVAQQELSGSYLKVIPASSIFFYPKNTIEQKLLAQFKDIESVTMERGSVSKLTITLHERTPAELACEGFHEVSPLDEDCFYADKTGYVFGQAPGTSTDPFIRYYVGADADNSILGSEIASSSEFENLQKFTQGVENAGIHVVGVLLSDNGNYEMYIQTPTADALATTTSEIIVYFDNKAPLSDTLSNFLAFWNDAITKTGKQPHFEYIDLRYGKNVYFQDDREKEPHK